MRLYASGSTRAFEVLYSRHKQKLHSFIRHQCGDDSLAQELTQDTWMAVIKQAVNYSAKAKFTTWLYRIAYNRLVDHWRKFGPSANVVTEQLQEPFADNEPCSDHIEYHQILEQLEELPREQLTALLLSIAGFSRNDIANITNSKPETVKSRLRYARNQLKAQIEV